MYFDSYLYLALLLYAYTFRIVIFFFLMNWSLYHYVISFFAHDNFPCFEIQKSAFSLTWCSEYFNFTIGLWIFALELTSFFILLPSLPLMISRTALWVSIEGLCECLYFSPQPHPAPWLHFISYRKCSCWGTYQEQLLDNLEGKSMMLYFGQDRWRRGKAEALGPRGLGWRASRAYTRGK